MTELHCRVAALEAAFRRVHAERMHGLPLLHPRLQVEAVGFAPDDEAGWALGVLVTPWCMNLLRLPLVPLPAGAGVPVGTERAHERGGRRFVFLGAFDDTLGGFEACSLASPMLEFADHDAAAATAREVLALLRAPVAEAPAAPPVPARRRFLGFGRAGAAR